PEGRARGSREDRLLTVAGLVAAALVAAATPAPAPEGPLPGAGGVKLYYRVQGDGAPVVLVHGGPGGSLRDLLPDLAPLSGFRLIADEQRGGGPPGPPPGKAPLGG